MSYVVNNPNTYDSAGLEAGKSEKTGKAGRTEAPLHTFTALKSSDTFPSYTAKTHRVTQTCNDYNSVGIFHLVPVWSDISGCQKITVSWTFPTTSQYLWDFFDSWLFTVCIPDSIGYMMMKLYFREHDSILITHKQLYKMEMLHYADVKYANHIFLTHHYI